MGGNKSGQMWYLEGKRDIQEKLPYKYLYIIIDEGLNILIFEGQTL
jgi:hypothetical protein